MASATVASTPGMVISRSAPSLPKATWLKFGIDQGELLAVEVQLAKEGLDRVMLVDGEVLAGEPGSALMRSLGERRQLVEVRVESATTGFRGKWSRSLSGSCCILPVWALWNGTSRLCCGSTEKENLLTRTRLETRLAAVKAEQHAQLRSIAAGIDPLLVKEVVEDLQREERDIREQLLGLQGPPEASRGPSGHRKAPGPP